MTWLEPTPPESTGPPPPEGGATLRRLAVETLVALAAYTIVAAAVTWPVARNLGGTVLGVPDSDSAGGIWWLDAMQAQGYHLVGTTRFAELAYPYGVEQANALNVQWLIPYLPAYLATKLVGAVAAYNLTIVSGFALSGAAMYLLARVLRAAPLVAGWAGLAFLVFPWHVERAVAGHASLTHLECFPLLVLALLALRAHPSRGRLGLVAAAVAVCWLTSGYFGVMGLVLLTAACLARALTSTPRRQALGSAARVSLVAVAVSAAVYAVTLLGAGSDPSVGATRSATDLRTYGLRPLELILPSPGNPTLRRADPTFWETRKHGSNIQEVSNYLGLITVALADVWLLAALRRRRLSAAERAATAGAAGVALVALLLSLPGSVEVAGTRFDWMPSRLLFEAVPAFRVPTRWTVVLFLATLVAATLGLQLVYTRIGRHRRTGSRSLAAGLVAITALGTWVELRVTHPDVHYDPSALPAEYRLLGRVPPGALAEYPLVGGDNSTNSEYLLRQREHGRPLLNGAPVETEADDERRALVDPEAPSVASVLAARGVVAAITRPNTYSRMLDLDLPERAPQLASGFALVGTTTSGVSVWRVTARPAIAFADLVGPAFGAPSLGPRGRIVQELRGSAGSVAVVARRPFRGVIRLALVAWGGERRVTIGGVTRLVGPRLESVDVPVSLPAGRTTLPVAVDGAAPDEVALAATAPTVLVNP